MGWRCGSCPGFNPSREREKKRETEREYKRENWKTTIFFFFFPKLVLQLATRKKPKHLLKGGNFTNTCL
jgi:hypothetical protein